MISKIIVGKNFYGCCRYVCSDKHRAEILEGVGTRDYNYKLMAHDFELSRQQLPKKSKAVLHCILSFYPGEKVRNESMLKIAKEYLEKLGIKDTQYVITKHFDKGHPHLHIIANLVNDHGKSISDSWIGLRGKKAAQELTKKYELIPAKEKNIALTNLDALGNEEATRYEIYQAITSALSSCNNLDDFVIKLEQMSIEVQYKYKSNSKQIQGISFKKNNIALKGSSIDRKFSLSGIQKALSSGLMKEKKVKPSAIRGMHY